MPREKDPFRDYVEFLQNDKWKWKCNFCNIEYRGSVTRIKAHLAGFGGYGINDCKKVDPRVRSEARKALKSKGAAESSNGSEGNDEEGAHQPVTTNNEDAPRETSVAVMPYLSFDGASSSPFFPFPETNLPNQSLSAQVPNLQQDFSFCTQPSQSRAGDSYIQLRNMSDPEALTNMLGSVNAEEGERNTEIPRDGRTDHALVDSRPSTCGLLDKNMPTRKRKLEEVSNREADMDESETWCRKSLPLVTTELVGEESEVIIKKICNYLIEDEIDIVGIYGMGGVGKTAILMHVHNRVLHKNPAFSNVFWVSVPQEFSVYELQDEIANAVGLDSLSKDKDVKRRASILHRHLEKMKSSILLLDGLWMHFEVKDVGIPIKKSGLKLVLTTRTLDVCHKMLCQKKVKIRPLEQNDSWSLFLEKLGRGKELPSEVDEFARSVLDKFRGLPRGIIEIATHTRGVEKVHEWKDLLRKLQESRMELDVLKELKLSYVNLGSPQVQRCFLHLVLCFGDCLYATPEEKLIESLIDEGLLGGIATRQKQHDHGNTILDKIMKSCLLDDPEEAHYGSVHPLIRDMALQIATSTTHLVKARMGLEEIPGEEFWTDGLEKVFLQSDCIKEIPSGISPKCPKLTRLSLKGMHSLKAIDGSFFSQVQGLKVLDLSNTGLTELPDAICHLESLEALLLQWCMELHYIPSVEKLGSLKKLDLKGCWGLEKVPKGMEMLVKLTYLDLRGTGIGTLPEGVLGKLQNLQYLGIRYLMNWEDFRTNSLEKIFLKGIPHGVSPDCPKLTWISLIDSDFLEAIDGSFFKHLKSLKVLDLSHINIRELPDSISHLESLEALLLLGCDKLRRIPFVGKLGSLRKLDLRECVMLEEVPEGMEKLVKLTYLDLRDTGIETLPEGLLGKLQNLQYLAIEKLRAGEEIKLRKVEELYCSVPNVETFNACTRFLEQNSSRRYELTFGRLSGDDFEDYERCIFIGSCHSIKAWEDGGNGGDGGALLLPKNAQKLEVRGCDGVTSWCEVGPLEDLESLEIEEWENLEELGNVDFPRLKSLKITGCRKLKRLWEERQGPLGAPNLKEIIIESCEKLEEISGVVTCGRLTYLIVNGCNNMKRVLLTQDMLLHLPSLEVISVIDCEGIEVIMEAIANPTRASFPKIIELHLGNLPELKSICDGDGIVSCDSLHYLYISKCPKLKRIPVQLPQGPVLPRPSSLPEICIDRQTWKSLECDYSPLQCFFDFLTEVKSPPNFLHRLTDEGFEG